MAHTKESIIALLETNDLAVGRAVVAIYQRQTQDEKTAGTTKVHNSIGFNGPDSRYLSYVATYAQRNDCRLSGKHLQKARAKIIKYAGQLLDIAKAKEATSKQ